MGVAEHHELPGQQAGRVHRPLLRAAPGVAHRPAPPTALRDLPGLAPQDAAGREAIVGVRTTESFATARFNGLHAYYAVDPDGRRQAFRYHWIPAAGVAGMTPEDDRLLPPQYLISVRQPRLRSDGRAAGDRAVRRPDPALPLGVLRRVAPPAQQRDQARGPRGVGTERGGAERRREYRVRWVSVLSHPRTTSRSSS